MPDSTPTATATEMLIPGMMFGAVEKVFRTMAHRSVRLTRQLLPDSLPLAKQEYERRSGSVVVGSVGFVGKAKGVVYVYLSEPLAIQLACDILGLAPAELDTSDFSTVNDAIGELTNVIAGTFKNQLCDRGIECALTVPSILHGSRLQVDKVANAARWVFELETDQHPFFVDVICESIP